MSCPSILLTFNDSLGSSKPHIRFFWTLLLIFFILIAVLRIYGAVQNKYTLGLTDFRQDYGLACCAWHSCNPYDRTGTGHSVCGVMPVSPHPLTVGIALLPLAWLPLPSSLIFWNVANGLGLIVLCALSLYMLKIKRLLIYSIAAVCACTIAYPTWSAFELGQIGIWEASLGLVSACLLGSGHMVLSGVLVGLLFCFKFAGVPLILHAAFRFRRLFWSTALMAGSIHLISVLAFGPSVLHSYLFEELPRTSLAHANRVLNQSLPFWSNRLFYGADLEARGGRFFEPLFEEPFLVLPITTVLLIATAALAVRYALRIPSPFLATIWLLGVDAIFLPVRWEYSGIMLLPAILALLTLATRKRIDFSTEFALLLFLLGFCFGGWLNQTYYKEIHNPSFISALVALSHQFSVLGLLSISFRVFTNRKID